MTTVYKIEAKSSSEIMQEAVAAAQKELRKWLPGCSVFVAVAWKDTPGAPVQFMSSGIPKRYHQAMAEGLDNYV